MRFMHIADVHLGALPDVGAPWSGDRGKELWQTFEKCIGEARARKVDLLLIAGDLFHRQPRGRGASGGKYSVLVPVRNHCGSDGRKP